MGYGGPRVEFYTANQYANHAAAIQREDAARVRSIAHRRTSIPEAEQLRQREEAFRAYEAQQAVEAARAREEAAAALEARKRHEERQQRRLATEGRHGSLSPAEVAARRARHARLNELAQPRSYDTDGKGSHSTYGCVMHPRRRTVTYPVGRNNAVYSPGVDRDRIVPARPVVDGSGPSPPWVGSYSTHHGQREDERWAAKKEADYYCKKTSWHRTAREEVEKQKTLREVVAAHVAEQSPQQRNASTAFAEGDGDQGVAASAATHRADGDEDERDAVSVFSHGSSNGPIRATGNQHICTSSTKESVQLHFSQRGGIMAAPRPQRLAERIAAKDLTLPELSHRLVTMQAPSAKP
jgi:hypothetical protein